MGGRGGLGEEGKGEGGGSGRGCSGLVVVGGWRLLMSSQFWSSQPRPRTCGTEPAFSYHSLSGRVRRILKDTDRLLQVRIRFKTSRCPWLLLSHILTWRHWTLCIKYSKVLPRKVLPMSRLHW